jgi:hypothetical protein
MATATAMATATEPGEWTLGTATATPDPPAAQKVTTAAQVARAMRVVFAPVREPARAKAAAARTKPAALGIAAMMEAVVWVALVSQTRTVVAEWEWAPASRARAPAAAEKETIAATRAVRLAMFALATSMQPAKPAGPMVTPVAPMAAARRGFVSKEVARGARSVEPYAVELARTAAAVRETVQTAWNATLTTFVKKLSLRLVAGQTNPAATSQTWGHSPVPVTVFPV